MIAEKTGWSYDFILNGTSWLNIRMMLADAPRMIRTKKNNQPNLKVIEGDELAKILGL